MMKPKRPLAEVLEEADRAEKRRKAMEPVWAFIACMAAGFVLYVFGEGLGAVFG